MSKKQIFIFLSILFFTLVGVYWIDFNRINTRQILEPKGKQTGKDFMLSSLNVTAISQDNRKLIWIGTSAGLNIFNGQDYIQFFHDTKDTTALPDDYINVIHRDRCHLLSTIHRSRADEQSRIIKSERMEPPVL